MTSSRWAKVRKIWAITGSVLLLVWLAWCAIAFRPNGEAIAAMQGSGAVTVRAIEDAWVFEPAGASASETSLLFFPGALVDPRAYAPLLRDVAARGHRVLLVPLPHRGVFGGGEDAGFLDAAHAMTARIGGRWAVAGHSKGGKIASLYAHRHRDEVAALVLIGTSHPRDINLADAPFDVIQVLGTRDTIASIARADRNRHNLPPDTSRIVVEGGNHSQFGDYGFQPGDRTARIPRASQRQATLESLLSAMTMAARRDPPSAEPTEDSPS